MHNVVFIEASCKGAKWKNRGRTTLYVSDTCKNMGSVPGFSSEMTDHGRGELSNALLRYCELDTLAIMSRHHLTI